MSQVKLTSKRKILVGPVTVICINTFSDGLFQGFINTVENILNRIFPDRTETVDVGTSGRQMVFYANSSGSVLPAVVLFFHKQVQFVKSVLPGSVLLFVIR